MRKIKYTCKNCGWETSIWEEWEDLKPQRCMNKKCNTSFRVNPDALKITRPEAKQEPKEDKKHLTHQFSRYVHKEEVKQEPKEDKKHEHPKSNKRKEVSNAE